MLLTLIYTFINLFYAKKKLKNLHRGIQENHRVAQRKQKELTTDTPL
jgi:hypothetical protein